MAEIAYEDLEAIVTKMPTHKFKNEHGEEFRVYSNGTVVFISGSETDGEILNLFNDGFNIWSNEEIYKLGTALQALALQNGHKVLR